MPKVAAIASTLNESLYMLAARVSSRYRSEKGVKACISGRSMKLTRMVADANERPMSDQSMRFQKSLK